MTVSSEASNGARHGSPLVVIVPLVSSAGFSGSFGAVELLELATAVSNAEGTVFDGPAAALPLLVVSQGLGRVGAELILGDLNRGLDDTGMGQGVRPHDCPDVIEKCQG